MNNTNKPSAIFATNYDTTLGSIKALVSSKMKINKDVSLIGYDHTDIFQILDPPLPVVSQPKEQIGIETANLLLKRMSGDFNDFPLVLRLKTQLLIHQ